MTTPSTFATFLAAFDGNMGEITAEVFKVGLMANIQKTTTICLLIGLMVVMHKAMSAVLNPLFNGATEQLKKIAVAAGLIATIRANKDATTKLKPAEPDVFDGDSEKAMSFLTAVNIYFYGMKIKDNDMKIAYVLSRIKGGKEGIATKWADAKRTQLLKYTQDRDAAEEKNDAEALALAESIIPFHNWADFEEKFRQHFCLYDNAESARDGLEVLTMGNNDCEHYTTMFKGYVQRAGYTDGQWLIRRYRDGLNANLRKKVEGAWPLPSTLEDWIEKALAYDRMYRKQKGKNLQPSMHVPKKEEKKKEVEKDPNAMEVDAISTERQDTRTCYHCNEVGHIAWKCPRKAEGSQPRGNGNSRGRGFSFGQRGGRGSYPSRQINAAHVEKTELEKLKAQLDSLTQDDQDALQKMFDETRTAGF
ncbi:hypothetical protein NMY22_g15817 [Coprinellus aureogranulatus]|nr:hypothetical protein NMY22_g15817 [Coprinellus aureogranulatus]